MCQGSGIAVTGGIGQSHNPGPVVQLNVAPSLGISTGYGCGLKKHKKKKKGVKEGREERRREREGRRERERKEEIKKERKEGRKEGRKEVGYYYCGGSKYKVCKVGWQAGNPGKNCSLNMKAGR